MLVKSEVCNFNHFGAINITDPLPTDTQMDGHTGNENIIFTVHSIHLAEIKVHNLIHDILFLPISTIESRVS